jgi:hypothetical protein
MGVRTGLRRRRGEPKPRDTCACQPHRPTEPVLASGPGAGPRVGSARGRPLAARLYRCMLGTCRRGELSMRVLVTGGTRSSCPGQDRCREPVDEAVAPRFGARAGEAPDYLVAGGQCHDPRIPKVAAEVAEPWTDRGAAGLLHSHFRTGVQLVERGVGREVVVGCGRQGERVGHHGGVGPRVAGQVPGGQERPRGERGHDEHDGQGNGELDDHRGSPFRAARTALRRAARAAPGFRSSWGARLALIPATRLSGSWARDQCRSVTRSRNRAVLVAFRGCVTGAGRRPGATGHSARTQARNPARVEAGARARRSSRSRARECVPE